MKKVILHGELGEKFGGEWELAINTPSEAIKAIQSNEPEFESFIISQSINGKEYTFRSENELIENLDLESSDDIYHIIPALEGSGIMGTLGSLGMGIFSSLLSGWIMKKLFPNKNKDNDQERINSNSYLYNGAENVEKQGIPVPIGYGRLRVGSKIISNALLNLDFDYKTGKVESNPFDFYKNQNLLQISIRDGKEQYEKHILTSPEHKDNLNNELTGSGTNLYANANGETTFKGSVKSGEEPHYMSDGANNTKNIGGGTVSGEETEYTPISANTDRFSNVYTGRITLSTLRNLNEVEESTNADHYSDFVCYQTIMSDEDFDSQLLYEDKYNYLGLIKRFIPTSEEQVDNQIRIPLNFSYDADLENYKPITRGVRQKYAKNGKQYFSKLESIGFYKTLDLICEGPIEGFVDEFGNTQQFLNSEDVSFSEYIKPRFQDIKEIFNKETGAFDLAESLNIIEKGSSYGDEIPNITFSYSGQLEQASIVLSNIDDTYQGKFDNQTNSLKTEGLPITPKTNGIGYSENSYVYVSPPIKKPCVISGIKVEEDVNESDVIYEGFGIYNINANEWSIRASLALNDTPNYGASYFSGDKINEQTILENLIFSNTNVVETKSSIKLIRENLDSEFHSQLNSVNANPLEDYGSSNEEDSDFLNAYQIAAVNGEEGDIFTIKINNDTINVEWVAGETISDVINNISQEINSLYENILISVVSSDNKILILQENSGYGIPPYITVSVDNVNSSIVLFDLRNDIYGDAFLAAQKYGAGYDYDSQFNYRVWLIGTDTEGEEKRCYFEVETDTYNDDLLEYSYKGLKQENNKPVIIGGLNGDNSNFDNTKGLSVYVEPSKTKFNLSQMEINDKNPLDQNETINLGFNSYNSTMGADYPELKISYSNQDNTGIVGSVSGRTTAVGIAEVSKGRISSFYIDTENEDIETYARYFPGETIIVTLPYPGSSGGEYIKIDRDRNIEAIRDSDIINNGIFEFFPKSAITNFSSYDGGISEVQIEDGGDNYSESDEHLNYSYGGSISFYSGFNGVGMEASRPKFINPEFDLVLEDNKLSQINILKYGSGFNSKFSYYLTLDNPLVIVSQTTNEEDNNWDNFLKGVYFDGIPVKNTIDGKDEGEDTSGIYNFSLNFDIDVSKKLENMLTPFNGFTKNLIGSKDQLPLDFAYHNNFKSVNFDSQLFGPRQEEESVMKDDNAFSSEQIFAPEDYFISHTIENLLVESIYVSLELKELYYVYEGDKEKVTINLGPIIAGLIMFLLLAQLAGELARQVAAGVAGSVPIAPSAIGIIAGSLAYGAAIYAAAKIAFDESVLGALGGLIDKIFDDILGWNNFLKFSMGDKVENSGEIWPAELKIKIEVSNEGIDKRISIVNFNSIATSSYVKDIKIDLPANPSKLKRIIKVSRLTREQNPVVGGEEEARYHKTIYLKNITEITPSVLSYPNSVIIGSRINSKDMPSIPKREYDLKLKLIALPSNYDPETREYSGIWNGLLWGQEEFDDEIEEKYLQWSDNPAWCIYDLLTNERYGIGKYGISHTNVDKWSLYEIGKYCDELVYSGTTPNFPFRSFSYEEGTNEYIVKINENITDEQFYTEFKDGTEIKGKTLAILGYLGASGSRRKIIRKIIKTDKENRRIYINKPLPQEEKNENGQLKDIFGNLIHGTVGANRFATVEYGHPIFEPRFSMNILIQDKQNAVKLLQNMTSFFNTVMYYDGGKIIFDQDKNKDPVLLFTNSNISREGFTYSTTRQSERPSVVIVRYNDATDGFQQKIEYVEDAEAISNFGYIEQEIDPLGITSRGQARRAGRYMLDTFQKETETVEFSTFTMGQYLKPGSLFKIVDNNRLPKKYGGRIMGINIIDKSVDVDFPLDCEIDPSDEDTHLKISVINPKDSNFLFELNTNESNEDIDFLTPQIEDFMIYKTSINKETLFLKPIKNITEQEFENRLKDIPLGSSWGVDNSNSKISTAVVYKAMNVQEKSKNQFEIQAIQHEESKFSDIEDIKLELMLKNKGFENREKEISQNSFAQVNYGNGSSDPIEYPQKQDPLKEKVPNSSCIGIDSLDLKTEAEILAAASQGRDYYFDVFLPSIEGNEKFGGYGICDTKLLDKVTTILGEYQEKQGDSYNVPPGGDVTQVINNNKDQTGP